MTALLLPGSPEYPELAYPGRKPTIPVRIDMEHRFAPDELCVLLRSDVVDLVSNTVLPLTGEANYGIYKGMETRKFSGLVQSYYTLPKTIQHAAGSSWTLHFHANAYSANDSVLLGVNGTTTDYVWLRTTGYFVVNVNGQQANVASSNHDILTWFSVVFSTDSYKLYKNGVYVGVYSAAIPVEELKIAVLGASYSSSSYGYDGHMSDVFIHSWGFSDQDVSDFMNSPYEFLIPA